MSGNEPRSRAEATARQASILDIARAVFWSFLGIRRKADYHEDATRLRPQDVILAGVLGAVILVLSLLLVVRIVVSQ